MTQKSNWIEVDENYWSESKSNAFNFDDFNDSINVLTNDSLVSNQSIDSKPLENSTQTKSSDLKLSEDLAQKQIQNRLNQLNCDKRGFDGSVGSVSTKLSPKEVINCLIKGLDINLNLYKGLNEKLDLLDKAIERSDGNAITQVVLHLNQTTKPSIFNHELSKRSLAANHYIFYLRQTQKMNELMDTLSMLGRHEEAAITAYTQAITSSSVEIRIQCLKNCLRNHFTIGGNDVMFWSQYISEYIALLEHQLPIETDDRRQERDGINPIFDRIPRTPLTDSPLITTLYYCCLYHYSLAENHFASPKAITKTYQLNQKQFVWTAVSALAKSQLWSEVDALFEYKSWLGNKRMKSCIPFNKVLSVLHKHNAPQELIQKYLRLIDDIDLMLNSAKELKLVKTAIDTLIKAKDKKKLEEVLQRLDKNTEEYLYLENTIFSMNSIN